MRIFKNKTFHQWTKEVNISDQQLKTAVDELNQGAFEATLGGSICDNSLA